MTETEKGNIAEKLIFKKLIKRGHKATMTPYHWPYDILVNDVCKIEIKYSAEKNGGYEFCLPEISKSDITILVCGTWKVLIVPTHKIKVHHLRITKKNNRFVEFENMYKLISDHVHYMSKLSRLSFSDALSVVGR